MDFKPHDYQRYCIDRIIGQRKIGLYIEMGMGKTVITLTAIRSLIYDYLDVDRALVIAPKKVSEGTWDRESEKWDHLKDLRISRIMGTPKERKAAMEADADVYILSRDNVQWLVEEQGRSWKFDMVILDESTSFKNPQAKRFRALRKMMPHIRRLVELTGTPSPNNLLDLWSQIFLLDEGERLGRTFGGYRERWFMPKGYINGTPVNYQPKKDARGEILQRISDICVSMKSEDYLTLPDLIFEDIPVALDPKAKKAYTKMAEDAVLELTKETEITALNAAALENKLLQLANGAVYDAAHQTHVIHDCKLEAFLELLEALDGEHALVFYSFQSDRDRILDATFRAGYQRVRTLLAPADMDAWNRGEVDILLAHPASTAYGLNLQQGGRHIIWYGLTWNYEQYVQSNARLHRQGQTKPVIVHRLICRETADEDVAEALERKDGTQQYIMGRLKAMVAGIRR